MNEIFPYATYRKEQFVIISAIQKAKKTLLIDAETGSGKTAAVLSAILSKKEPNERIIIYTKMLGQMDAWYRELGLINDFQRTIDQSIFTMVPLVGKSHVCPLVTKFTRKQFSQLGCKLFDCLNNSAYFVLQSEYKENNEITSEIINVISENTKKGIGLSEILWILNTKTNNLSCPYLAIKSALKEAEIVITTYPFLWNNKLHEYLKENMDFDLTNTTIIIDEAHNLAQSEFGELSYKVLYNARNEIGSHKILEDLISLQGQEGLHSISYDEQLLKDLFNKGQDYLLQQLERGYKGISNTLMVSEFLENLDNCYLTADKKFTLYLKDPRTILAPIKNAKQVILLSGTFRPLNLFADFLGVPEASKLSVLSEVIGQNRIILTSNDPEITMRYKERSPERYLYYSETIRKLFSVIPGHVLVFTPNYELTAVFANILKTPYVEVPNQSVSKLIKTILALKEKALIIAPARGKISEGIEIVKDDQSIISAVIMAGLPYPPPSRSLKEIIKEYSRFWGEARANNYMNYLQAIVTMRQCLGRMIRSENDIGAWIILDNRINRMNVFPRAVECKNTEKMIERLQFFYQKHSMYK